MKRTFIRTKNVKRFVSLMEELQKLPPNIPKLALVYGEHGLGKGEVFPPEKIIANIIQILKIEPSELFAFNQYIEQIENNQEYKRVKKSLTPREFQVLWYICRGYDNTQIAEQLEVSTHTAKAHVAAILRKFGVKTRTAVAYIAGKNFMV